MKKELFTLDLCGKIFTCAWVKGLWNNYDFKDDVYTDYFIELSRNLRYDISFKPVIQYTLILWNLAFILTYIPIASRRKEGI